MTPTPYINDHHDLSRPSAEVRQPQEIRLKHLTEIEDPRTHGKTVVVDAIVSSTVTEYIVPKTIESVGQTFEISPKDPVNLCLIRIDESRKDKRIKRWLANRIRNYDLYKVKDTRTIYEVRVRPPARILKLVEDRVKDEAGFEYKDKPLTIYIVAEKRLPLETSTRIRVKGVVIPEPWTQRATILAYDIEFPEDVFNYDVQALNRLRLRFDELLGRDIFKMAFVSGEERVRKILEWYVQEFEKYSGIIQRHNVTLAVLLTFTSPLYLELDNHRYFGFLKTAIIGDTTTGKSRTAEKAIELIGLGTLITAETASRVGLTGTVQQIERIGWIVDWGMLPLNDGRLLVVDGANRLTKEEWSALAEAERTGKVIIAKAGRDEAKARVRTIKIANPVNPRKPFETASMSDFDPHPITCLPALFNLESIARLDLIAFTDTRDVPIEEITKANPKRFDEHLLILRELVKWVWSGRAKSVWRPRAKERLIEYANNLYHRFYVRRIPLINEEIKVKLARIAEALAHLVLSTDFTYSLVYVEPAHVEIAKELLEKELERTGLHLVRALEEELPLPAEPELILTDIMEYVGVERRELTHILKSLATMNVVGRDDLRNLTHLSEPRFRKLLEKLKQYGLIEARARIGIIITPSLRYMVRNIEETSEEGLNNTDTGQTEKTLNKLQDFQDYQDSRRTPISEEKGGGSFLNLEDLENLEVSNKAFVEDSETEDDLDSLAEEPLLKGKRSSEKSEDKEGGDTG